MCFRFERSMRRRARTRDGAGTAWRGMTSNRYICGTALGAHRAALPAAQEGANMNRPLVPIYSALSAVMLATATAAMSANEQPMQAPAAAQSSTVTIVSGTYGPNCGAPQGNLTADLALRCNGRDTCSYSLPGSIARDGRQACRGSFVAEWRCGQHESHVAMLGAGATPGDELVMTCVRFGGAGK